MFMKYFDQSGNINFLIFGYWIFHFYVNNVLKMAVISNDVRVQHSLLVAYWPSVRGDHGSNSSEENLFFFILSCDLMIAV